MGNPAMVKRKKTEKRRKKYEQRLGPGAYMPRDERLQFNAEYEKAVAAAIKERQEFKAKREKARLEKKANAAAPAATTDEAKK